MHSVQRVVVSPNNTLDVFAGVSVAVTNECGQLALSTCQLLNAHGAHARAIDTAVLVEDTTGAHSTGRNDANHDVLLVTTMMGDGTVIERHWQALLAIRAFVTTGGQSVIVLQDTDGRFESGPSNGWHGGAAALARTAALEWPEISVRCIDVAVHPHDTDETAHRLLKAMTTSEREVGIDLTGQLHVLRPRSYVHVDPTSHTSNNDIQNNPAADTNTRHEHGVWLVSGGARGVTADCIKALATRASGCFVLLGRSSPIDWPADIPVTDDITVLRRELAARALANGERPVPKQIEALARSMLASEEIRDTLVRLSASGVDAHYYACDITNRQHVMDVVKQVRDSHGQISALVHGAGVLADSLIADKTYAQLERVFETKVHGLQNLLTALDDATLSHVALFSSAAAFYGNKGQADYAMANEILNRVAHALKRHLPNASIKSFNWGPWASGMVDATLARYFEDRGIALIPVAQGAEIFAREMLDGDSANVEVLVGDTWEQ